MSKGFSPAEHNLVAPTWFWGVAALGIVSSSASLLVWTLNNLPPLLPHPDKKNEWSGSVPSSLSLSSSRIVTNVARAVVREMTSFWTILQLSVKEDYPLWLASLWFLWKQQPITSIPGDSTGNAMIRMGNTTTNDSKTRPHSSLEEAGGALDSWVTLARDFMLLGSLLVCKKFRERQSRRPNDLGIRPDKCDGNDETGPQTNDDDKTESNDAVNELRRLLKQSAADHNSMAATLNQQQLHHLQHPQQSRSSYSLPMGSMPQRYIEILVHNVSHTDLVLSLDVPSLRSSIDSTPATTASGGGSEGTNHSNKSALHTAHEADSDPPIPQQVDMDFGDDYDDQYCLCRPRFSAFDAYSQRIVDFVNQRDHQIGRVKGTSETTIANNNNMLSPESIISFPRYERSDETNSYRIKAAPTKMKDTIPIGFRLDDDSSLTTTSSILHVSDSELHDLRVRGRDASRVLQTKEEMVESRLRINAAFFPLLATLMPIWQAKIKEKYGSDRDNSNSVKQVLFLVSGVGSPRNWTHSVKGNSTQQCATLMKYFLQSLYPNFIVVQIHSETNIFRYDENIAFVQQELLPRIQGYRDAHAKGLPYPDEQQDEVHTSTGRQDGHGESMLSSDETPFSTEWRKSFSVAISFADGSPARTFAIQAALRSFKPTFFHFWQLKTFWHDSKIVESDIEIHSFEEMETMPPVETTQLQDRPIVSQVVEEMKKFRDDMMRILSNGLDTNDIRSFWLRKTHKPVLAVLAVHVGGGRMKLYRGTNMEVSMPTGSLCAERNVIGTALSDNPSLKRQDLKMIAVLAVPNPESMSSNGSRNALPRQPSTLSLASLPNPAKEDDPSYHASSSTRADANSPMPVPGFLLNSNIFKLKPPLVSSRKSSLGDEDEWVFQDANATANSAPAVDSTMAPHTQPSMRKALSGVSQTTVAASLSHGEPAGSGSSTPARRIPLYKPHHKAKQEAKLMVVVHSNVDINPLRPCGACNEWLKKIAESNPYFQILTFTDAECNGVYCTSCEE